MYKNLAATLVAACCFLSLATHQTLHAQAPALGESPIKAAWVYVAPITPQGWVKQHDEGRRAVEAALGKGVKTTFVENVSEGADAERVIRDLATQGNDIIFTPSFGYMEPTLKVAKEFPLVKFESITGYKRSANVATANARFYEGRYLAGVAAGRVATQLGYLAGFPVPEVLQGINAFAIGARSVNPAAQVRVVWLNEWFNPPKEREAANALFDQGVEVLAFHTGSSAPMAAAQARGRLAIGYHSDMSSVGPQAQLLAVTHHWGDYYLERVKAVQGGTWTSSDQWRGMAAQSGDGAVRVGHFGPALAAQVRVEVAAKQGALFSGRLHVFAGPLTDNTGVQRAAKGAVMQDAQVLMMDWLAQGVVGSPK